MTSASAIPPGLILIAAGLLLPFLKGWARSGAILLFPLVALWLVWQVPDGIALSFGFLDLAFAFPGTAAGNFDLVLVKGDRLGRLFATVFSFMAFAGGLFAIKQKRTVELSAAYVYGGSAIGVCFAGDMITMFIFWELMALASTLVIWSNGTVNSYRASMRYLSIHLLGGVLLMAGIVDYVIATKSIAFGISAIGGPIQDILGLDRPGTWLILAGFLINAGAPPLSSWLPDAYPEASYSGMVFLSAFTTKTAVFVLLRSYQGFDILMWIGLYMVFYGIVYALLENDMRRILAYSIINQVGFMVCGIGIGGAMAVNGAAAHAFTHIIYKALLLMSAGAVLAQTGKRKCTDLGGLFQTMPITMVCGVIGALSISSFPLTSGFISKSMISQGAANGHMIFVWMALMAASAGVFLHAGIKFPWFVFFQKDSGLRPPDPGWHMRGAMILMSIGCIGLGVWPEPLYAILPFPVDFVPYTGAHVLEMLQLLLFSGLAFFVLLPLMKRTLTISLDLDWTYRIFGAGVARIVTLFAGKTSERLANAIRKQGGHLLAGIFRQAGPDGILARSWQLSGMVAWIAILLAVYMVIYFVG